MLPLVIILGTVFRQTLVHQLRRQRAFRMVRHVAFQPEAMPARQLAPVEAEPMLHPYLSPNNYIAPDDFARAAFDYSIRRHPSAKPRRVTDRGGFAIVPLLLCSRRGASYLTHRKICLN